MGDIASKLITRNRWVSVFLFALGAILSGILCWGYVLSIQAGLSAKEAIMTMPGQLEIMWGTVVGLIVGGHEEEINKAEKLINKDLDGDGDIGVDNAPAIVETPATPATVASVEVVADAESNAKLYTV